MVICVVASSPLRPDRRVFKKILCFLKNMPWSFLSSPLRLSVPIGMFSRKDVMFSRKHAMVISVVASPPLRPDRRVF